LRHAHISYYSYLKLLIQLQVRARFTIV
jgi:hypothetical protein